MHKNLVWSHQEARATRNTDLVWQSHELHQYQERSLTFDSVWLLPYVDESRDQNGPWKVSVQSYPEHWVSLGQHQANMLLDETRAQLRCYLRVLRHLYDAQKHRQETKTLWLYASVYPRLVCCNAPQIPCLPQIWRIRGPLNIWYWWISREYIEQAQ